MLDGGRYLAALEGLAGDPEPMVVGAVLDSLGRVRGPLVPGDLEDEYAAYLRRALRPALDGIGLLPREGESETATLVRPRLLLWLGDNGRDPDIRRFAEGQATAYLADPASVPPSIAGPCLILASMDGTAEAFEAMKQRFESAETPTERERALQALGAFRDPELIEKALDYAFSGPLRTNELFTLPASITQTPSGKDRAYRWMRESYGTLAERLPRSSWASCPSSPAGAPPSGWSRRARSFRSPSTGEGHPANGREGRGPGRRVPRAPGPRGSQRPPLPGEERALSPDGAARSARLSPPSRRRARAREPGET